LVQPVWEVEVGAGPLIAGVAILHATLAQLSTGTALLLPAVQGWAARRGDAALLGWVRRHAAFLAGGVRALSAVAGAGLWLVLTVAAPSVTGALARALLWPFLLAWLAALVSLVAGLAYARGFDRLSARAHRATGWLGAGASVVALLLSQATLAFMADPDATFERAGLVGALATPLLGPSFLLRLAAAVGLAGLAVLATAWREPPEGRGRLARLAALAALPGALAAPAAAWLWLRVAGAGPLDLLDGEVQAAALGTQVALWAGLAAVLGLAAVAWQAPRRPSLVSLRVAAPLLALALLAAAGGEYLREAVRRPWAIGRGKYGVLYATGLTPDQLRQARTGGLLTLAPFSALRREGATLDQAGRGRELFALACRACHTLDGVRAIRSLVDGLPREAIAVEVKRLERLPGRMPPFPGSPADADDLVFYLAGLDGEVESPPPPPPAADLVAAGRRVFEYRCLTCHRDIPLRRRVAGWTARFAYLAVGRLPRFIPAMPAFAGDDDERRAVAAYLAALGAGQVE
jgi:mono/diheme cytochrome c family protein